jgi:hypothetical protein
LPHSALLKAKVFGEWSGWSRRRPRQRRKRRIIGEEFTVAEKTYRRRKNM